jgi:hypothetical protein
MGRQLNIVAAIALLLAACTSSGAAPTAAPATATPVPATPVPATPVAPTLAAPIDVTVTFDGSTCVYAGPLVVRETTTLRFSLANVGTAAGPGADHSALVVAPVVDGTTWDTIVTYVATHAATEIPAWVNLPDGVGAQAVQVLYPETAALGQTLSLMMMRNAYYVGCHTAPETTDRAFPATLILVMKG